MATAASDVSVDELREIISWIIGKIKISGRTITGLAMVASLISGWFLAANLGDKSPVIGVAVAAIVDVSVILWMPISHKLHELGIESRWAMGFEFLTIAMTLAINVGSPWSHIITPRSEAAYICQGVLHGFGPAILVVYLFASVDALRRIRRVERDLAAEDQRKADQRRQADISESHARTSRVSQERIASDHRIAAQANLAATQAELASAEARREASKNELDAASAYRDVELAKIERQRERDAVKRSASSSRHQPATSPPPDAHQAVSPATHQRSPGGFASAHQAVSPASPGAHQMDSPGRTRTKLQVGELAELAKLAGELLADAGDMGRGRLANELANELAKRPDLAPGLRVSSHTARLVLDELRRQKIDAEIKDVLDRAERSAR